MYCYSPFWASGGVLTRSLWDAKDDPATGYSRDRDRFAAALIADVLEQARDDAQQKGGRDAAIFLASLRDDLATFAPTGPPTALPGWPSWCEAFFQALWNGETVGDAARSVGKSHATVGQYRNRDLSFKQAYDGLRERGMVERAA